MTDRRDDFAGLEVVVTGGAGALGTAVCALLLARGARVHVPALDEGEAARFALAADPRVVLRVGFDLADENAVEAFYACVPGLWASIHVAGGYAGGPILETTPTQARRLLSNNAMSAWLCAREAVRRIRARPEEMGLVGGRIVNVAAKPALVPTGGLTAYAMSKAAVAALTTSLAEEVRDEGIWVNAVVPSTMDTAANRAAMPHADHARWPSVAEVAETLAFLASPTNRATRGALVPVYGRS
jgi:NAD(P)-dependent dehydrogenase (short-subunit alcohol dehydrogenase family)